MRRINWDDEDLSLYATKCLTAAWNVRYNSIHCLANLVSGLALYHEHIGIHVVDAVIEDIRLGLELNLPKYNQRRVSMIKYLAELYNYRMVESSIIFKTLYTLITYGVTLDTENSAESLDQPSNFFRIRLVCAMLDTCGQYFDRGNTKKKLDCFLVYFQRYYLFKKETTQGDDLTRPSDPVDIEFTFYETLSTLRNGFKFLKTYSESVEAVAKMEQEVRESLNKTVPWLMNEVVTSAIGDDGLQSIREDEEDDDASQMRDGKGEEFAEDEDDLGRYGEEDEEFDEVESGAEETREGSDSQCVDSNSEVEEVNVRRLKVGGKKEQDLEDEEFCKAFDSLLSENIAVSFLKKNY